jgi:hypothetical protein
MQCDPVVLNAVRDFLRYSTPEARANLVAATSALSLRKLDAWESAIRAELWADASRSAPSRWTLWRKSQRPLSWLDLCNADGFVRERALRCLSSAAPNAFFFVLALRRLNDWVPQVRQAAREHIPLIAESSNPEHVVDALWNVLPHSIGWGRMERIDWQVLTRLLASERVAIAAKTRITTAAAGPGALMLAQIGRTSVLDRHLQEIASDHIGACSKGA